MMTQTLEKQSETGSEDAFSLYLDNDAIQSQLFSSALILQSRFAFEEGTQYKREDIQKALISWLELSLESLIEDTLFHVENRDQGFGYTHFQQALKRVRPIAQ